MRTIKFRAWDLFNGEMAYSDKYPHIAKFFFYVDSLLAGENGIELMQFTGLLDKNGKEIYEGDITKDSTGVCLIDWNDKLASFCLRRNGWAFDHFFGEAVDPSDVEVIGNIYENPELLK